MLDRDREQALGVELARLRRSGRSRAPDARVARHLVVDLGNREAAFVGEHHLLALLDELGVDQDDRLVARFRGVDDDDALVDVDLRRREADAFGRRTSSRACRRRGGGCARRPRPPAGRPCAGADRGSEGCRAWLICDDSIQRGRLWMPRQRKEVRKVSRAGRAGRSFVAISMLYGQNLRSQVRFSPNRDAALQAARKTLSDRARGRCGSLHETFCMSRRILPATPLASATRRPRARLDLAVAAARGRAELPDHAAAARHRQAHRRGGRAAERDPAERARHLHRQAPRHALGHLEAVPEEPVALARALGHEPRAGPQPAPDLPRPDALPRQVERPRPAAHGRAGRRRRRRQPVAADPLRATSRSTASPRSRST